MNLDFYKDCVVKRDFCKQITQRQCIPSTIQPSTKDPRKATDVDVTTRRHNQFEEISLCTIKPAVS